MPYALGTMYEKACLWELRQAGVLRSIGDNPVPGASASRPSQRGDRASSAAAEEGRQL
jgi:hypothetical protein